MASFAGVAGQLRRPHRANQSADTWPDCPTNWQFALSGLHRPDRPQCAWRDQHVSHPERAACDRGAGYRRTPCAASASRRHGSLSCDSKYNRLAKLEPRYLHRGSFSLFWRRRTSRRPADQRRGFSSRNAFGREIARNAQVSAALDRTFFTG